MAYGAFWLTFAYTIEPSYVAYISYATDPTNAATASTSGLNSPGFNASFGKLNEHKD